jgi:hypothetical protein
VSVGRAIGPIGAVLAAIVAALMLGTLLWIVVALASPAPPGGDHGRTPGRIEPDSR